MNTLQKMVLKRGPVYVLILPCVLLLILMMIYPIYQTLRFSIFEVKLPAFDLKFAGLDNFTKVFSKEEITTVFKNTLLWIVGAIILKFFLGFWAAIIFNVNVKGGIFLRILCLIPWTVPSIVSSNLWRWIFQSDTGLLNVFFRSYGMEGLSHNWLGDPNTALYSVMFASAWAGFPFVMLMLLAGMQGIPKEMFEAGEIDGANKVQLFRYITIPSLKPIIVIVLLLQIIHNLNAFDLLYVLTGGGPGGASEILGLFIYRIGFTNFDFGGASAISVTLLVLAVIFFVFYGLMNYKVNKRGDAG
ncbi:carbohydrate ABC transporter permease [Paenibacillus radicis (ex Xue et al. 2023)]|uniref:Sugar ABC transporter permease n=1 Tax=Paenibacillus radicis (ex Xue et al. 2023) TaxID=2972489 RepID=A0ABT1YIN7_9BACL|nr:sugar ABC transporter permease [Paenibacillus radicis (ex Xue et al. 2023)]MCR8633038.1 sugar ABC transporter permease [Paenibacillus radicis (ex Xue et al. 2023)]